MKKRSAQKKVNFMLLPSELCLRANPNILLMNMKGGKRAEAGQWFLEVQKLLYGIRESVIGLENFMNQTTFNKEVTVDGQEITMSDEKRYWMFAYLIDNAILRIFACLDKLAQMVRVFYEHPEHGGVLRASVCWSCRHRECQNKTMDERNCNFGSLLNYLRYNPRDKKIDDTLIRLSKDKDIQKLRLYRSGFVHRKNRLDSSAGLDPDVNAVYKENGTVETTFSYGGVPAVNWFRIEIVKAHNAIVECIAEIGDILFPKNSEIKLKHKRLHKE